MPSSCSKLKIAIRPKVSITDGTAKLSGQNATNFQDIEAPGSAASPFILTLDMFSEALLLIELIHQCILIPLRAFCNQTL